MNVPVVLIVMVIVIALAGIIYGLRELRALNRQLGGVDTLVRSGFARLDQVQEDRFAALANLAVQLGASPALPPPIAPKEMLRLLETGAACTSDTPAPASPSKRAVADVLSSARQGDASVPAPAAAADPRDDEGATTVMQLPTMAKLGLSAGAPLAVSTRAPTIRPPHLEPSPPPQLLLSDELRVGEDEDTAMKPRARE